MDREQVIAGAIGAVAGTDWWDKTKVRNIWQGLAGVIIGTVSAVYLTPLIAKQFHWNTPEQVVGVAFAIGTLGLRSVQLVNAMAEKIVKKLGE
jgi:hypothetical protein